MNTTRILGTVMVAVPSRQPADLAAGGATVDAEAPIGAAGAVGGPDAPDGGTGAPGIDAIRAVTGVTMMPVTSPFTAFFCFLPMVWRAARVALALAAAAAFCSGVLVACLGGENPKSASTGLVGPNRPIT